jgi:hypothetical protein
MPAHKEYYNPGLSVAIIVIGDNAGKAVNHFKNVVWPKTIKKLFSPDYININYVADMSTSDKDMKNMDVIFIVAEFDKDDVHKQIVVSLNCFNELSKNERPLVIGIEVNPFNTLEKIRDLYKHVLPCLDSLLVTVGKYDFSYQRASESLNMVLGLLGAPNIVGFDFSDVKFQLSKAGITLLGVGVSAGTRATLRNATEQIISSFPLEVYQRDTICIIANFKASIDGRKLVQEMSDAVESIENAIPLDPYSIIGGSSEADLGDTKQAYLIISII